MRHLGLSEVTADELRAAVAVHPIAAVESEWSIWSRDVERNVVPAAAELGVGFVPYSPLGRGFLTGTIRSAADLSSTDFRRNLPRYAEGALDANLAVVEVVKSIADQQGATAAQVALAWLRYRADAARRPARAFPAGRPGRGEPGLTVGDADTRAARRAGRRGLVRDRPSLEGNELGVGGTRVITPAAAGRREGRWRRRRTVRPGR